MEPGGKLAAVKEDAALAGLDGAQVVARGAADEALVARLDGLAQGAELLGVLAVLAKGGGAAAGEDVARGCGVRLGRVVDRGCRRGDLLVICCLEKRKKKVCVGKASFRGVFGGFFFGREDSEARLCTEASGCELTAAVVTNFCLPGMFLLPINLIRG